MLHANIDKQVSSAVSLVKIVSHMSITRKHVHVVEQQC